ncbi:P-loop containing nucleoside triphosphate hydrolase [Sesbania bispinosa]|nr:P-loop containing nucleoside triphosphate hydrolase [Sesbania bispinosa]
MKDRPSLSSYGAIYVPPHHRLRSTVTSANHNSSHAPASVKLRENHKPSATTLQTPLPEQLPNKRNSRYVSAYDDGVSEEGSDRDFEVPPLSSGSSNDNIDEWKRKLAMLLNDKSKQELISREKKDRRDFEQIAVLASRMGLYREHLRQKSRMNKSFSDLSFARSSSNGSIGTDEGLFEQPEPLASSKALAEKVLWQRSLQMRNEQQAWQESPEGRTMLEFRSSLPAYKEKEAILSLISRNQYGWIAVPAAAVIIEKSGGWMGEGAVVVLGKFQDAFQPCLFLKGLLLREGRNWVNLNLNGVTHVIVDEIHERGMNEDFMLIVLKDLLPRRPELKLILMSATLDAELFSSYFNGAPIMKIPGFTYPVRTHFLENILEMTGYRLTPCNQIDDYGQERMWKMNKQAPRKRKSQIASAVEVVKKF